MDNVISVMHLRGASLCVIFVLLGSHLEMDVECDSFLMYVNKVTGIEMKMTTKQKINLSLYRYFYRHYECI